MVRLLATLPLHPPGSGSPFWLGHRVTSCGYCCICRVWYSTDSVYTWLSQCCPAYVTLWEHEVELLNHEGLWKQPWSNRGDYYHQTEQSPLHQWRWELGIFKLRILRGCRICVTYMFETQLKTVLSPSVQRSSLPVSPDGVHKHSATSQPGTLGWVLLRPQFPHPCMEQVIMPIGQGDYEDHLPDHSRADWQGEAGEEESGA